MLKKGLTLVAKLTYGVNMKNIYAKLQQSRVDLQNVKERFFIRMTKTETCWLWTSYTQHGYGCMKILGKSVRAHRLSYFIHNGVYDTDLCILHKCDNPLCVNPDHLFIGTQQDNVKDMHDKKRHKILNPKKGENQWKSKLKKQDILQIRFLLGSVLTNREIAKKYNVSQSRISDIKNNKAWCSI